MAHRREPTPPLGGRALPQQKAVACIEVISLGPSGKPTNGAPVSTADAGGCCR